MSTPPSIGHWVWGEALNPCQVIAIGAKRSTGQTMLKVLCPQGSKVISLESVKGVVVTKPNLLVTTRPIQVGDRVKLKNTNRFYTIIEVFEVPYWINGDRTVEMWARCQIVEGRMATWKLGQLETIKS
jgi:hypothetical protein